MATKIYSTDLKVGMFVADLDRPWVDTPFLLQGFLVCLLYTSDAADE